MAEPFVAEVRPFAFDFAPRNWAQCDGSLLPVGQQPMLHVLIGYTFGGDHRNFFGIPNLNGRAVMGAGTGPGLSDRKLGASTGYTTASLANVNLPEHTHPCYAELETSDQATPGGAVPAILHSTDPEGAFAYTTDPPDHSAHSGFLRNAGGGKTHPNQQPYLAVNYCIALIGEFPSFD